VAATRSVGRSPQNAGRTRRAYAKCDPLEKSCFEKVDFMLCFIEALLFNSNAEEGCGEKHRTL
jgi:hypothetical protein